MSKNCHFLVKSLCKFLRTLVPLRLYTLALAAIGLAVAGYALLRRKSKTADDIERERRAWLSTVGRITDGTVIDVQEIVVDTNRPATMLIYQYDVAGVKFHGNCRRLDGIEAVRKFASGAPGKKRRAGRPARP